MKCSEFDMLQCLCAISKRRGKIFEIWVLTLLTIFGIFGATPSGRSAERGADGGRLYSVSIFEGPRQTLISSLMADRFSQLSSYIGRLLLFRISWKPNIRFLNATNNCIAVSISIDSVLFSLAKVLFGHLLKIRCSHRCLDGLDIVSSFSTAIHVSGLKI